MRIIIIEDEELTANDLAETILSISPEHAIVKTLGSVAESIAYLKDNHDFDLIFSDIELGDGLSFEIFNKVALNKPIIFCTAFNEYALQAFQASGIDYILKPFDSISVERSLMKLKNIRGNNSDKGYNYNALAEAIISKGNTRSILCYKGDKIIPLKVEEIALAYIENEISYVIYKGSAIPMNQTLDELEQQLGSEFFRANRQVIINRKYIKEVNQYFFRKLLLVPTIDFHMQIVISKAKSKNFLQWLQQ